MGLDAVEYISAIEESFNVEIPDAEAARMVTPRDVVDYLTIQVPVVRDGPCLSQRAFYRLRAALREQSPRDPLSLITPDTELDAIVPQRERGQAWQRVRDQLGAAKFPGPPTPADWFRRLAWWRPRRVRAVIRYVVAYAPRAVVGEHGWTRPQIAAVVTALCEEEFGVDMRRFTLDSEFVRDMGVD